MKLVVAFASGALFALGLAVSGMTDPYKVRGFLAFTDPSLALVMAGALAVFGTTFRFARRRQRPLLDAQFHLPTQKKIDARLILGSVLFGVGWGLSGLCPGPALFATASGRQSALLFTGAFLLSAWGVRLLEAKLASVDGERTKSLVG